MTSSVTDPVVIDRFDLANAAFWLAQVARWLADPDHAHRFAHDLWAGAGEAGPPLTVIVGRAAAALRTTLDNNTETHADVGVAG